jgi:hypothetical protein
MTGAAVRSLFNLGVVQLLAPARQLILSGKKKRSTDPEETGHHPCLQYCYTFRSNSMSCVWLTPYKFCMSGCSLAVAGETRQSIHPSLSTAWANTPLDPDGDS